MQPLLTLSSSSCGVFSLESGFLFDCFSLGANVPFWIVISLSWAFLLLFLYRPHSTRTKMYLHSFAPSWVLLQRQSPVVRKPRPPKPYWACSWSSPEPLDRPECCQLLVPPQNCVSIPSVSSLPSSSSRPLHNADELVLWPKRCSDHLFLHWRHVFWARLCSLRDMQQGMEQTWVQSPPLHMPCALRGSTLLLSCCSAKDMKPVFTKRAHNSITHSVPDTRRNTVDKAHTFGSVKRERETALG